MKKNASQNAERHVQETSGEFLNAIEDAKSQRIPDVRRLRGNLRKREAVWVC